MQLRRPNEKKQKAIELLIEHSLRMDRGEVLKHKDIARIADVKYKSAFYYSICDAFKKRMEADRHITLIVVAGVGYRLLPVSDQIHEAPAMRTKRARVQLNKGIKSVRVLMGEDLPIHQKQAATVQLDAARLARRGLLAHSMAIKAATAAPSEVVVPPQFRTISPN